MAAMARSLFFVLAVAACSEGPMTIDHTTPESTPARTAGADPAVATIATATFAMG